MMWLSSEAFMEKFRMGKLDETPEFREWSGELGPIPLQALLPAIASPTVVTDEPARTWVHRCDQREARGITGCARASCDTNTARLQWDTQALEHFASEEGQLVQEQDSEVPERSEMFLEQSWSL